MDKEKISVGQAIMNKIGEILGYCVSIDKKVNTLHNENMGLYKAIQGFSNMQIRSQIPYMTPKQLVSLKHKGWTMEEMSYISGYTIEDVQKKIAQYKNV